MILKDIQNVQLEYKLHQIHDFPFWSVMLDLTGKIWEEATHKEVLEGKLI